MRPVRRVAFLSLHTSPLDQPGIGDAGGMNVYLAEITRRLAGQGVQVDVFTRSTGQESAPHVPIAENALVHYLPAGPQQAVPKEELPALIPEFTASLQEFFRANPHSPCDILHSHYWLSGMAALQISVQMQIPLVHTMHTMARVKNMSLAAGDLPEPVVRASGEQEIVDNASALVANTPAEAADLQQHYGASSCNIHIVSPGVDTHIFHPGSGRDAARAALGWDRDENIILFVGRIQPLKAPDVLIRALTLMPSSLVSGLRLVIAGGQSGSAAQEYDMPALAQRLGVAEHVDFQRPCSRQRLAQFMRAADFVAVPSHNESFGLVAVEAGACGTPVVAASVGGLPQAVGSGGMLVHGHDPQRWAACMQRLLDAPALRADLGRRAVINARNYSWDVSVDELLAVYEETLTAPAGPPEPCPEDDILAAGTSGPSYGGEFHD